MNFFSPQPIVFGNWIPQFWQMGDVTQGSRVGGDMLCITELFYLQGLRPNVRSPPHLPPRERQSLVEECSDFTGMYMSPHAHPLVLTTFSLVKSSNQWLLAIWKQMFKASKRFQTSNTAGSRKTFALPSPNTTFKQSVTGQGNIEREKKLTA